MNCHNHHCYLDERFILLLLCVTCVIALVVHLKRVSKLGGEKKIDETSLRN